MPIDAVPACLTFVSHPPTQLTCRIRVLLTLLRIDLAAPQVQYEGKSIQYDKIVHTPYFASTGPGDDALLPPPPPRYALLKTRTPFLSCATSLINAVNLPFCSSVRRYGVKCEIQSRVLAFGVLRSHSMTMLSSSSIG